jgi:hypothetical protein
MPTAGTTLSSTRVSFHDTAIMTMIDPQICAMYRASIEMLTVQAFWITWVSDASRLVSSAKKPGERSEAGSPAPRMPPGRNTLRGGQCGARRGTPPVRVTSKNAISWLMTESKTWRRTRATSRWPASVKSHDRPAVATAPTR